MAVHHRANGYVAVCIEPDGGCAMMLFSEKWSDHHHAAMQARLLAAAHGNLTPAFLMQPYSLPATL